MQTPLSSILAAITSLSIVTTNKTFYLKVHRNVTIQCFLLIYLFRPIFPLSQAHLHVARAEQQPFLNHCIYIYGQIASWIPYRLTSHPCSDDWVCAGIVRIVTSVYHLSELEPIWLKKRGAVTCQTCASLNNSEETDRLVFLCNVMWFFIRENICLLNFSQSMWMMYFWILCLVSCTKKLFFSFWKREAASPTLTFLLTFNFIDL